MKRTTVIASLSLLGFCFFLLIPLPENQGDRFLVYLQDFAHFPLFALMAWLFLFLLRKRNLNPLRRGLLVVAATLSVGILAELIQPFVGRTAGVRDVVLGLAGSVAAVCLNMTLRSRAIVVRVLLVAITLLLAFAAVFPLILITRDRQAARRDFPLLASFESNTELSRWSGNGCGVSRVPDHTTHGQWALKIEVEKPDNYPGLFESDSMRNLAGIKQLCFDVFVPGEGPLKIWLRMDDRINPVYFSGHKHALHRTRHTRVHAFRSTTGPRPHSFVGHFLRPGETWGYALSRQCPRGDGVKPFPGFISLQPLLMMHATSVVGGARETIYRYSSL